MNLAGFLWPGSRVNIFPTEICGWCVIPALKSWAKFMPTLPVAVPAGSRFSRAISGAEYVNQRECDRQDHWSKHDSQHTKNLQATQHSKEDQKLV